MTAPRGSVRPRTAMILAAGRGERMRPLSDAVPKPLLRVRGVPLIERHVRALVGAGIAQIVINLCWLGSQIREHLGDGERYGAAIRYSEEAPLALEAAGGIVRALPNLSPGPFVVVNGDIFTDYRFDDLLIGPAADAHLVLVRNPQQHPRGDFGLDGGWALADDGVQCTFSGIAVYRTAIFDGLADGARPLKPLLLAAIAARRCSAELYHGIWEDVGTVERLHDLNAG